MWTTIREKRFFAGLSQQELANALNASRQTISAIENRHSIPSVTLAIALAAVLETTVEELFAAEELRRSTDRASPRAAPPRRPH
jgi:putative transcriptional regulator